LMVYGEIQLSVAVLWGIPKKKIKLKRFHKFSP